MSKSAFTVKAFSVYVLFAGAAFALVPGLVLASLGLAPPQDVWPRLAGMLAVVIGVYYWTAARSEARAVMAATVFARGGFSFALLALVGSGLAPKPLLLFAALDLAGAAWTRIALRSESAQV